MRARRRELREGRGGKDGGYSIIQLDDSETRAYRRRRHFQGARGTAGGGGGGRSSLSKPRPTYWPCQSVTVAAFNELAYNEKTVGNTHPNTYFVQDMYEVWRGNLREGMGEEWAVHHLNHHERATPAVKSVTAETVAEFRCYGAKTPSGIHTQHVHGGLIFERGLRVVSTNAAFGPAKA